MKRKFGFILSTALFLIILSAVTVCQAKTLVCGDFRYELCDQGAVLTKYVGSDKSVSVPSTVDGNKVVMLKGTFYGKKSVESVKLPNTLEKIGFDSFSYTKIEKLTVPSNVTYIHPQAFINTVIKEFNVSSKNKTYCSVDGVLYSKGKTVLVSYPLGKSTSSYKVISNAKTIGSCAFWGCKYLKSIEISKNTHTVKNDAFAFCSNLENLKLHAGLKKIGTGAFRECKKLKNFNIPITTEYIGSGAFENCDGLTQMLIPKNVAEINMNIFRACDNLKTLEIASPCRLNNYGDAPPNLKTLRITNKNCILNTNTKSDFYPVAENVTLYGFEGSDAQIHASLCHSISFMPLIDANDYSVTLSSSSFTFNGKERKPTVTVKNKKGQVINSRYYSVRYSSGRTNAGKYNVIVTFKGKYGGMIVKTYIIRPKQAEITSAVSKKKTSADIHWRKRNDVSGWEIQYSRSSDFKNSTTVKIADGKRVGKSISSLKSGKKYYFRMRTYKYCNYQGNSIKVFSYWSPAKSVKIK
ncbi:MAG: leucine-rich repeat domain-containing protein [Eubacterium sp.]